MLWIRAPRCPAVAPVQLPHLGVAAGVQCWGRKKAERSSSLSHVALSYIWCLCRWGRKEIQCLKTLAMKHPPTKQLALSTVFIFQQPRNVPLLDSGLLKSSVGGGNVALSQQEIRVVCVVWFFVYVVFCCCLVGFG